MDGYNNGGNKALSIVSLVLGILSIVFSCCCYGVLSVLFGAGAIVCAVISNKQGKTGLAKAGMICAIVGIVLAVIWLILTLIGIGSSAALTESLYDMGYYY